MFIVLTYSLPILSGAGSCRVIMPDEDNIIGKARYNLTSIKSSILAAQATERLIEEKDKGIIGERAAVKYIHSHNVLGHDYTSIRDVLTDLGCSIMEDALRGAGNQGIDDIFVVTKMDETPNYSHKPLFHESKFSSSCRLVLPNTKTMCQQMSLEWLKTNMEDIAERATGQVEMCLGTHILKVKSCEKCREDFQAIVRWLQSCIAAQYCYRTASVVCPDGNFILYQIK
ncbi:MAG: hypothetical protein Q8Q56_01060 [Alphaproteobacteria bacterium]|nr:hypothetical protein [Alphaproteobacteria bacterium]